VRASSDSKHTWRIQKRKTNFLQSSFFGLQRAASLPSAFRFGA
jgi:hypothetical protein